ncbi:MAG: efflux RND transporter permease subunit [Planctomycetota bacterium]|jgi:Cu(I)/Ag(I) efflux system membrane protein CusA/SilA
MIEKVIHFFLHNAFVVLVLVAVLVGAGLWAIEEVPVDAIPDIGENQAIVFTQWMGRSPKDVYDQITYPLSTELEGIPGIKTIRGISGFGFSTLYVIFEDNVDFYWARTRVLEKLNTAGRLLPEGVVPSLGPDATAMGQIFWYTVENGYFCPEHGGHFENPEAHREAYPDCKHPVRRSEKNLQELRSIQDWLVRYQLNAVEGVSEVASVGGYVKQYQIDVDPDRMRAHGVKLAEIIAAVKRSNLDVGAKVVQDSGMEFLIRGVGFIQSVEDVEDIVVRARDGVPINVKNVARVHIGPDFRRGALDKEGAETVGGVVVMRFGDNPLKVIQRVKEKIEQIVPALPAGVRIVPFYDRTGLIKETIGTLKSALSHEIIITIVVILLFLLHLRSSLIVAVTLPLAVLLAFVAMVVFGVDANIMSLSGIAIAIGTMVDMGIIMTENIYSQLSERKRGEDRTAVIFRAASEVGPAILTAISTTIISFLPVFMLTDQEGKLFVPLAWTKTFALFSSVLMALIVVPVLCRFTLRTVAWNRRKALLFAAGVDGVAFFAILIAFLIAGTNFGQAFWTGFVGGLVAGAFAYRIVRETLAPMGENPVSRAIQRVYEPLLRLFIRRKSFLLIFSTLSILLGLTIWLGGSATFPWILLGLAGALGAKIGRGIASGLKLGGTLPFRIERARLAATALGAGLAILLGWAVDVGGVTGTVPVLRAVKEEVFPGIGREFMPPLDEGSFLYMPSLLPSASFKEVQESMEKQDLLMKQVPEVDIVVGKLGRVESALDPAPVGMIETVIMLKPESEWRRVPVDRWFSGLPGFLKAPLAWIWPESRRIKKDEILQELRMRTDMTGVAPSWLQPIETRVVMLQSGFKGQMGVKVFGDDLAEIERIGLALEEIIKAVPGAVDVVADRIVGKPYVEFRINREAASRFGVKVNDIQTVLMTALGGKNITQTVEGEERYPVRVRYEREMRDNLTELSRILVPTPSGAQVPITHVAQVNFTVGPAMIRSEHTTKVGYVTFNARGRDEVSVAEDVMEAIRKSWSDITEKTGYWTDMGGRFENQIRATKRLMILVPLAILLNFFILFLNFKSFSLTVIVFMRIPVTLGGGFLLLWITPALYPILGLETANLSVAVWVGFIALFGIAVDDGVIMATYINQTFRKNPARKYEDIRESIVYAGKRRIRPCLMTTITTILALIPVLLSTGRGADVMKPMAIPSVGGMLIELISLFGIPVSYCGLLQLRWKLGLRHPFFAVDPKEAGEGEVQEKNEDQEDGP